jgi:hypothetical protein
VIIKFRIECCASLPTLRLEEVETVKSQIRTSCRPDSTPRQSCQPKRLQAFRTKSRFAGTTRRIFIKHTLGQHFQAFVRLKKNALISKNRKSLHCLIQPVNKKSAGIDIFNRDAQRANFFLTILSTPYLRLKVMQIEIHPSHFYKGVGFL